MKRQREENPETKPEPRRSKRQKKNHLQQVPKYFKDPCYTWERNRNAGGKKSTAILGPNSLSGMGTDANSKLPSGIEKARGKYKQCFFKAGHLLNADFGGDGKDGRNLTILTATANTFMTSFDNNIKKAVEKLEKLYESVVNNLFSNEYNLAKLKYGIQVTIEVSEEKWGAQIPDSYIAKSVKCKAEITGERSLDNLIQEVTSFAKKSQNEDLVKRIKQTEQEIKNIKKNINSYVQKANQRGDITNKKYDH